MKVISTEDCKVYDENGERHQSTMQLIDTGIVINGQPVIEWNFVTAPGIIFARRSQPFQVKPPKQPKCDEKYWRRVPRVKREINGDIYRLKCEMRDIKKEIKLLDTLIKEKGDSFGDVVCMLNGLKANQGLFIKTMGHPCERTASRQKEWTKVKRTRQKEYETLHGSRAHLDMLYRRLHKECLQIRINERK